MKKNTKVLYLSLKAKPYDQIESGEKKEEYREIKGYWLKRLCEIIDINYTHYEQMSKECVEIFSNNVEALKSSLKLGGVKIKDYTHVKFSYGYTKRTMTFEIERIAIGKGKPEWGAPAEDVFIIKLGKRV